MTRRCERCGTTNLKFVRSEDGADIYGCKRGAKCGRETRFEHSEGVTDAGAHLPPQTDAVPVAPSDQPIPPESLRLYRCRLCLGFTVTVQLHDGEILESIDCRAKGFFGCPGAAPRVEGAWPTGAPTKPAWEWVRLYDLDRIPSDENAIVAQAMKLMPLTLRARQERVSA